jgi:hypothetical protein
MVTPNLGRIYGSMEEETDDVVQPAPGAPSAEQILDKYIQALGGEQRLAGLSSFAAKGTSSGYGPEGQKRPVEIYAQASGQRTSIIHTDNGDSTTVYDGHNGWISAPLRPVAVLPLTGGELDGAKLDADIAFPARIKQVVQGTTASGAIATLYFDPESGLLLRQLRFANSPVGRIPTQIDYSDYRDVAGVKVPFHFTLTWLDGRENFELTEIRPNVTIDAAKFAKPAPPAPPAAKR